MKDRELIEIPLNGHNAELVATALRVLQIVLVRYEPGTARQVSQEAEGHVSVLL